jgi:hypothetical protein
MSEGVDDMVDDFFDQRLVVALPGAAAGTRKHRLGVARWRLALISGHSAGRRPRRP